MSKNSDGDLLLATGLGLLLGLGMAKMASIGPEARKAFRSQLREDLGEYGLDLVSCDVGRTKDKKSVWHVTLNHPARGAMTFLVEFEPTVEPYAPSTAAEVAQRVVRRLATMESA